ncbi:hypothetical protein HKD37_19G052762 [Glycine soja]
MSRYSQYCELMWFNFSFRLKDEEEEGNSSASDLAPLDLEIEATCRRNNIERRRKILQDRTTPPILEEPQSSKLSSIFPEPRESQIGASKADIMAEDQPRRVTLEDYSSSTLNIFMDGLRSLSKQLLDAFAGGKIKLKTPKEAMELIQNMAASDHAILRDRTHIPIKRSLLELSSQDALLAQNKLLSKQLEALTETLSKLPNQLQLFCRLEVAAYEEELMSLDAVTNKVQIIARIKGSEGPTLEISSTRTKVTMSNHKSIESAIKNLEIQVGQLAKQIVENSSINFGANTEKNPKEECKAIMTRSRKAKLVEDEGRISDDQELVIEEGEKEEEEDQLMEEKEGERKTKSELAREKKKEVVSCTGKEAPYPLVPSKKNKERHLAHFLDIFKKLEIMIPFGKALQQMSLYSKFLKDLLTRKIKYIHSDNIVVEGNCSAVIQRILPPKHKDLGSVTIPCSIGPVSVGKALIDLGANINLMPFSICKRIRELEIMPTRMTLQLAGKSITRPYGVIEDVLVKVQHFTFPIDFVVMDIEEDSEIPLILGRPFMLTASCVVDMGKGKLEMGMDDQKIKFDLFDAEKHLLDWNVCLKVEELKNEMVLMARAKLALDP